MDNRFTRWLFSKIYARWLWHEFYQDYHVVRKVKNWRTAIVSSAKGGDWHTMSPCFLWFN